MIIEAFQGPRPRPDLCVDAAKFSIKILGEIAARKDQLSEPVVNSLPPSGDGVPFKMWEGARQVGARDLTPMATVAGAVADATADFLHAFEMSKTIVNNGGDIAIRLAGGESVNVGIRSDINRPEITHRISISEDLGIGGVCTSGLGGRSFTRGIASATTILARSAVLADAAATAVANATFIDHPNIVRRLADKLDPQTDLKGVEVTCSVGDLEEEFVEACLYKALAYAETLADKGTIFGAVVSIKGQPRITKGIKSIISLIS
ncbi:MAG: UPF0280 family protein [Deltaproteobacteria bacterium]|jgi:hypothetical protein|nr:UPF0280 family protein [Deltaproteobacteria bacterium]